VPQFNVLAGGDPLPIHHLKIGAYVQPDVSLTITEPRSKVNNIGVLFLECSIVYVRGF